MEIEPLGFHILLLLAHSYYCWHRYFEPLFSIYSLKIINFIESFLSDFIKLMLVDFLPLLVSHAFGTFILVWVHEPLVFR